MKMEAIRSSETSVHTRFTRRRIPEDGILHNHRRENLKSYKKDLDQNAERSMKRNRMKSIQGLKFLSKIS
jgi:hypothetical protein